jgi:hypothetical protein
MDRGVPLSLAWRVGIWLSNSYARVAIFVAPGLPLVAAAVAALFGRHRDADVSSARAELAAWLLVGILPWTIHRVFWLVVVASGPDAATFRALANWWMPIGLPVFGAQFVACLGAAWTAERLMVISQRGIRAVVWLWPAATLLGWWVSPLWMIPPAAALWVTRTAHVMERGTPKARHAGVGTTTFALLSVLSALISVGSARERAPRLVELEFRSGSENGRL